MGIIAEKREVSPGVWKAAYMVVAEAINRYTGKRVQKKRRGIQSKTKAQLIYKELLSEVLKSKEITTVLIKYSICFERAGNHSH